MLILARRVGERIAVDMGGVQVLITVVDVDRGRVRLGFAAPDTVSIQREELFQRPQVREVDRG